GVPGILNVDAEASPAARAATSPASTVHVAAFLAARVAVSLASTVRVAALLAAHVVVPLAVSSVAESAQRTQSRDCHVKNLDSIKG
ncbi:hypothetical protein BGX21_002446, partial [Mortierella sp. AD011]